MNIENITRQLEESERIAVRIADISDKIVKIITMCYRQSNSRKDATFRLYTVHNDKLIFTGLESNSPQELE